VKPGDRGLMSSLNIDEDVRVQDAHCLFPGSRLRLFAQPEGMLLAVEDVGT
jgi:hypothetical protein